MTLYFSRRQMKGFALDLETRGLNDLDEKAHNLVELFIGNPQFIRLIYNDTANLSPDIGAAYYIQFMCGHAFRTRQRGVLGDNEWAGWMQWMKDAFRYGTIGKYWKETGMGAWFDPAF